MSEIRSVVATGLMDLHIFLLQRIKRKLSHVTVMSSVYSLTLAFYWYRFTLWKSQSCVHMWRLSWLTKNVGIINLCLTHIIFGDYPKLTPTIPSAFCWWSHGDINFLIILQKYITSILFPLPCEYIPCRVRRCDYASTQAPDFTVAGCHVQSGGWHIKPHALSWAVCGKKAALTVNGSEEAQDQSFTLWKATKIFMCIINTLLPHASLALAHVAHCLKMSALGCLGHLAADLD